MTKTMETLRAEHHKRMAALKQEKIEKDKQLALEVNAQKERIRLDVERKERVKKTNRENGFQQVTKIVSEHLTTLTRKYHQLTTRDDYGLVDYGKWDREKEYFIQSLIRPNLNVENFDPTNEEIHQILDDLVTGNSQKLSNQNINPDHLTGVDYELLCAQSLLRAGWKTSLTKSSGDQGVDVIAEKGCICLALQCKRYSGAVGNAAVQQVYAGMRYVRATHGAVVSNAPYTPQAQELA